LSQRVAGPKYGAWAVLLCAAIVSGACASSGAVPQPFPMPKRAAPARVPQPPPAEPAAETPTDAQPPLSERVIESRPAPPLTRAEALVDAALAFRGVPYRNGGTEPDGFDCSGFTQYVFARFGIALPRDTRRQYGEGDAIDADELAPGDLLFFTTVARGPSHVAIAINREQFVHAPSSTGVVRVERLGSSYWSRRYVGARRVKALNRD
jgi:cell wall-associated NlpC family hydrolase